MEPESSAGWTGRLLRRTRRPGAVLAEVQGSVEMLRREALYRRLLAAADVAAAALATIIGSLAIGHGTTLRPTAVITLPLVALACKILGLYDRDEHLVRKTTLDELPAVFGVATLFALMASLGERLIVHGALTKVQVVAIWVLMFSLTAILRAMVRRIARDAATQERCLVIGDADSAERLRTKFDSTLAVNAIVVGRVPLEEEKSGEEDPAVLGDLDTLGLVLVDHDIHRAVIAPGEGRSEDEDVLDTIRLVKSLGVNVSVLPRLFEVVGSSVKIDDVEGVVLLGVPRFGLSRSSRLLKRGMDVAGAGLALVVLSPLVAWIALAIRLTSSGPVLFRQKRIGQASREFVMFKFRTMVDGAEARQPELLGLNEADGLFKIADDPRVTRVGRFLRQTSLDELPQLINVLRGEMSLVGPRPLVPAEDGRVEGWRRRRLTIPPGMTGMWQIFGSSRIPLYEMVKIDYLYGANWSLWGDIKILIRTIPYAFSRRGL